MTLYGASKRTTCVSALPFLIASLVVALVYIAVIVLAADGFMSSLWDRLRDVPPTAFIVFSAHCAISRRPRRRWAVLFAVLSALAWTIACKTTQVEMMGVPWNEVWVLLPEIVLSHAILSYLVVISNMVARSFLGPDKRRLTLRTAFAMITTAAVLLTWIAKSPIADYLVTVLLFFHIPYVLLYGLAAWSAFRSTVPAFAILLTLVAGVGFGWATDQVFSPPSDWYVILSPGVYTATLVGALLALRIADHWSLGRRASGPDAPSNEDAIVAKDN